VSAMHITAASMSTTPEEGLIEEHREWLERSRRSSATTGINRTGETNGDAHLKSLLMHQRLSSVTSGKLDLGPVAADLLRRFDGRRRKRVIMKVMGE